MKKILLSLAIIAIVGTVTVGATRAIFSKTSTITGNTVSTAELKFTATGVANGTALAKPFDETNLVPGQWTKWVRATLYNQSNVSVKIYMYVDNLSGTCDKTVLKVTTGWAGTDAGERVRTVFNNWISALNGVGNRLELTGDPPFLVAGPNITQVIQQQAQLHDTADDSYQNTSCTWDEVFIAESVVPSPTP